MAYANNWVVKSETSGKFYGPFSSAHLAGKWGTANFKTNHWIVIRLRRS